MTSIFYFKVSRYFKLKCPTFSVKTLYIFYCEDTGFSVPSGTFLSRIPLDYVWYEFRGSVSFNVTVLEAIWLHVVRIIVPSSVVHHPGHKTYTHTATSLSFQTCLVSTVTGVVPNHFTTGGG